MRNILDEIKNNYRKKCEKNPENNSMDLFADNNNEFEDAIKYTEAGESLSNSEKIAYLRSEYKLEIEELMQYVILKQRYINLGEFLKEHLKLYKKTEYYDAENPENPENKKNFKELQNLMFLYNDLREINYIGTDMFANAMFIKNKVPFYIEAMANVGIWMMLIFPKLIKTFLTMIIFPAQLLLTLF